MQKFIIVVAGGKGLRMGAELPKQFMPVAGQPVLMRTLLRCHEAVPDARLILALPKDHQDYWSGLCAEYDFRLAHRIADGGETRFHSVRNALELVDGAEGVVAVHDGVRPFVSAEVVRRVMQTAEERGSAVPVVPVVETLRRLQGTDGSHTVDRDAYRLVQTPQAFRLDVLRAAYGQAYQTAFTDDASVVEALGKEITLVEGNRENIKLTTPEDLKYAEFLCRA